MTLTGKITKGLAALSLISFLSIGKTGTADLGGKEMNYTIKKKKKDTRKVIVLHAGHGKGNRLNWEIDLGDAEYVDRKNDTTYYESDLTLYYVKKIKKSLEPKYKVYLSREDDEYPISLEYRSFFSNNMDADLSFDFHFDNKFLDKKKKTRDKKLRGFTVYYWDKKNKELAKILEKNLKLLPTTNRGIKRYKYDILKETKVPIVLLELGFLANPYDKKYITDTIPDVENAIVKSIDDYFRILEKKDSVMNKFNAESEKDYFEKHAGRVK